MMTNDVVIKEEVQIQKIGDFFETSGLVDLFVNQYGYQREYVCREGLAFANKITLHDLQESDTSKQFKACTPVSKQQVFTSILAWGLPTDSRDLYYLYNNKGQLTCEPSYKGLIYIAEQNGLNIHAGLVFEGDEFELKESDAGDNYTIKRANPFMRKNIEGCYVRIVCKGEQRVYTYSFEELESSRQASLKKMRGAESPAWKNFKNDMYLKCGVRKAIKIAMAKISVSHTIQALFDDEMAIPEESSAPQSIKTADFESTKSVEYNMDEAEKADEVFKQQQFAELQAQFDYRNETNEM